MAYFDELLQRAITVRNNRAPASNTADLVGGVLVGIVTALQMLLDDKQDELTFDTAPTANSQNPVTSDGIYQALQAIDLSACEKIVNKVTSINAQSTDVQYPTAKLLYDSLQALSGIYAAIQHTHAIADIINLQTELNARQLVSNLVTAITAQSTDVQYPSAKLLYDSLQALSGIYAAIQHTHAIADIINLQTELNAKANTASLAAVAFSGDYDDLDNKPTIPSAPVNADWNATSGLAEILNKPTNVSVFANDAGYLAAIADASTISGTMVSGHNYILAAAVNSINITSFVDGYLESNLVFTVGSASFSLSLPSGTKVAGTRPTWENGAQYIMSVWHSIVVFAKLTAYA